MNSMTRFVSSLLLSISIPAFGADPFSSIEQTPLKPINFNFGETLFSGELQISGEFHAGWVILDGQPDYIKILFFPDPASKKKLPYLVTENGSDRESPIIDIELNTTDDLLKKLLSEEIANRLLNKELFESHGHTTLIIHNYFSRVECDHRSYGADIKNVLGVKDFRIVSTQSGMADIC